jgi:DNA replication licensing factor MCM3
MPDSLLSRFDLVFVVLDKTDDEFNRAIADHVTRLHRYLPPGVVEGTPVTEEMARIMKVAEDANDASKEETPVFEKYNELLHIGIRTKRRKKQKEVEVLSIAFLKKYLHYAKNRVNPVLTTEAADFISTSYSELRAKVDGTADQYRVF